MNYLELMRRVERAIDEKGDGPTCVYVPPDADILTTMLSGHGLTWDDIDMDEGDDEEEGAP